MPKRRAEYDLLELDDFNLWLVVTYWRYLLWRGKFFRIPVGRKVPADEHRVDCGGFAGLLRDS